MEKLEKNPPVQISGPYPPAIDPVIWELADSCSAEMKINFNL